MGRMLMVLLALVAASPAGAQQVYKCVAADGAVVYQSQACGDDTTVRSWDHGHYAPPSQADQQRLRALEQAAHRRAAQRPAAATVVTRQGVPRGARPKSAIGQCDAARKKRDEAIYRLEMRRNVATLRRLDKAVFEACR